MKKLLLTLSLTLIGAIASFGLISAPALAATLTPAQAATLEQSLAGMKAQLLSLEAKAQAQTQTPAVSANAATMQKTLAALSAALAGLQTTLAAHPDLATQNADQIMTTLAGVETSLVSMQNTLGAMNATAVALTPAAPAAPAAPAPVAQPTKISVSVPPTPTPVAPQPSVAQKSEGPTLAAGGSAVSPSAQQGPAAPAAPQAEDQTASVGTSGTIAQNKGLIVAIITFFLVALVSWYLRQDDSESGAKTPASQAKPSPAPQTPPMLQTASRNPAPQNMQADSQAQHAQVPQTSMEPKRKPA